MGGLIPSGGSDVVAGEVPAILGVDGSLHGGHGGDATTGVIARLPGAVTGLALEAEVGTDVAVLDLPVVELVGAEDLGGRVVSAELVSVDALPEDRLGHAVVITEKVVDGGNDDAVGDVLGGSHVLLLVGFRCDCDI